MEQGITYIPPWTESSDTCKSKPIPIDQEGASTRGAVGETDADEVATSSSVVDQAASSSSDSSLKLGATAHNIGDEPSPPKGEAYDIALFNETL